MKLEGDFYMTIDEKMNTLQELLDIDMDTINEDTLLDDLSEWDSIAIISTIAMMDSMFDKVITSQQVKKFKTISDIINEME